MSERRLDWLELLAVLLVGVILGLAIGWRWGSAEGYDAAVRAARTNDQVVPRP